MKNRLLLLLFIITISNQLCHGAVKTNKSGKVLFIGNSYTFVNNLPALVEALARSKKKNLRCQQITSGGASLGSHWAEKKALKAIQNENWEYVILQDQSAMPMMSPESTIEYGVKFCQAIHKQGAKPLFFLTWAYRSRDPKKPDNDEMLKGLMEGYCLTAKAGKADLAPVGLAWHRVLKSQPKFKLHSRDGSHPNIYGSYLAAIIFYAKMTNESPIGLPCQLFSRNKNGQRFCLLNIQYSKALELQKHATAILKTEGLVDKFLKKIAEKEAKRVARDDAEKLLNKDLTLKQAIKLFGKVQGPETSRKEFHFLLKNKVSLYLFFNNNGKLKKAIMVGGKFKSITFRKDEEKKK